MNKKIFFFLILLLSSVALYAQNLSVVVKYLAIDGAASNDSIIYQPNQFLNWENFKGTPVESSDAAALTNAGFGLKLAFHRVENVSQLVIGVNCVFSGKQSWVKSGNKTAYILNHEQRHFDIAYIHTILFMKNIKAAHFTNTNYTAVIENIFNESVAAMNKMQVQYDAETNHSKIPERQAGWDEKISQQLLLADKE